MRPCASAASRLPCGGYAGLDPASARARVRGQVERATRATEIVLLFEERYLTTSASSGMTTKGSHGGVIDPVRGRPVSGCFERNHGSSGEEIQQRGPVREPTQEFCLHVSVGRVVVLQCTTHEVLQPTLFLLILRPGQQARENCSTSLGKRPLRKPGEEVCLTIPTTPPLV